MCLCVCMHACTHGAQKSAGVQNQKKAKWSRTDPECTKSDENSDNSKKIQ